MPHSKLLLIALSAAIVLISGCRSTLKYVPKQDSNPPPTEAFSQFSAYETKIIALGRQCKKSNEVLSSAMTIQRQLDEQLPKLVASWKAIAPESARPARTLRIAPVCSAVVRGKEPGVLMKVRYSDVTTGAVIAEPVFYQGMQSPEPGDLPARLTKLIMDYTRSNYASAVGGPTGTRGNQLAGVETD